MILLRSRQGRRQNVKTIGRTSCLFNSIFSQVDTARIRCGAFEETPNSPEVFEEVTQRPTNHLPDRRRNFPQRCFVGVTTIFANRSAIKYPKSGAFTPLELPSLGFGVDLLIIWFGWLFGIDTPFAL
jgi:hypothetical protein